MSAIAKPERKKLTQLSGKSLSSGNIGIKTILNPRVKSEHEEAIGLKEMNEEYTAEQLEHLWKKYALEQKRNNRDSLYATLTSSEMIVASDHTITLKIQNSVQANELDTEKVDLIQYLRVHLKNTNINLVYEVKEKSVVNVMDSKSKFDKLAEENTSLHKFRKLFNLDIEY
ncbi:hypothetical protein K6119_01085 [Paracrocinitomix mangrovi]|uniref:hypothetical protein n=1 Tax=Paracrocinitomix mangrovi TaxID=2862509 RepID=UPI001C8E995F|nr:hypothetical protein [Paracrocinitomix mangrovi]UKN02109.1 hypothetical protein K6119_01085 [Paracrocinitomix mangrovi]